MRCSWGVQVMLQAVEVMMRIFAAECAPPSPFPPILTYLWLSLSGRASAPSPGTSAPCPAVGWLRRPLQCQCSAPLRPCLPPSQQASAATNWTRSKYGRLMMTPDRCCRKKKYVSVSRWYAFINVVLFFLSAAGAWGLEILVIGEPCLQKINSIGCVRCPIFTIRWRQIAIFFSNVGQEGEHPLVCLSIRPTIHPFSAPRPGKYGPCDP